MTEEKERKETYTAGAAHDGLRLDQFLAQVSDCSRSRINTLIKDGKVFPMADADTKVKAGDVFVLKIPRPVEAKPIAQDIPLDILFEDDDLIVINKPAGLTVHPGAGQPDGTLVNALIAHCGDSLSGIGGIKRPGIVHRIDKETSGVLVVAKNDFTHHGLAEQFANHSICRVYTAFVYGIPPSSGTVVGAIGRSPQNRQKMAIVPDEKGKPATTHYRLIKSLCDGKISMIECRLETGRTHQIRVHMTSIKHPLVGDKLYGSAPRGTPEILRNFPRQALHAGYLSFIHPRTKKEVSFQTPLPDDLKVLLEL